jgi:hypothetical protein
MESRSMVVGVTIVGALALAYYCHCRNKMGGECPLARQATICTVTPFHNTVPWAASQTEKEKIARAWMEKYVRSVLLKRPLTDAQDGDGLRMVIANEKGLLKADFFDHVQKIIEVYSKSLLCEIRQTHRAERLPLFEAQRWPEYVQLVREQYAKEVKIFNKATIEILTIANIKASVFNQSVELFLISAENTLLKSAQTTIYSPF